MKPTTTRNSMLLLLTAAIWGAAFVAQTTGGDAIGSYSFNCIRSLIGRSVALVLRTGVFNPDFICGLLFTQSGWCETFCVTVFNNGSTYGNPNVLG